MGLFDIHFSPFHIYLLHIQAGKNIRIGQSDHGTLRYSGTANYCIHQSLFDRQIQ